MYYTNPGSDLFPIALHKCFYCHHDVIDRKYFSKVVSPHKGQCHYLNIGKIRKYVIRPFYPKLGVKRHTVCHFAPEFNTNLRPRYYQHSWLGIPKSMSAEYTEIKSSKHFEWITLTTSACFCKSVPFCQVFQYSILTHWNVILSQHTVVTTISPFLNDFIFCIYFTLRISNVPLFF